MSQSADIWYVRLPDGRVVRANTTRAVRHHIRRGRIPLDSRVRRSPEEEWVALEWAEEFAAVAKQVSEAAQAAAEEENSHAIPFTSEPGGIASRLDPLQLQTVGVRGFLDELLAAMDSTLVRKKLLLALLTGLLGSVVCLLTLQFWDPLAEEVNFVLPASAGGALLLILLVSSCILTQLTYVELSRLRPAQWKEGREGLGRSVLRLLPLYLVICGGFIAAILGLHALPSRFAVHEAAMEAVAIVALFLEVILWPLWALALLLVPLVIVEEASTIKAIGLWLGLLRQHLLRILVYEALAAVLGLIVTLPLTLPIVFATVGLIVRKNLSEAILVPLGVMWGLALGPLFAYMTVANVFIYLNLRYEQAPRRK